MIWEVPKTFSIQKPQPNIGHKRILEKQWQHSYLCDRVTKTLNDEVIKKKLEKEKAEKSAIKEKTIEEEEAQKHLEKLGYKKKAVVKEDNTRHPPCTFFTTSYNPKGEKFTKPSL